MAKTSFTERINALGFSFVYFLSTYLGSLLIFIWLMGISALSSGIPISLFSVKQDPPGFPEAIAATSPSQLLFAGIGMLLLVPLVIFASSVVMRKIRSIKLFAILTFFILLVCHIQVFPGLFSQRHHLLNPPFYLLVGSYLLLITGALTYLWKTLILENSNTDLPWKTYILSFFIFLPVFYFFINGLTNSTYMPLGDYLFKYFVINIYFLDWSGYFGLWLIMSMLGTLVVVTKLLHGQKEHH